MSDDMALVLVEKMKRKHFRNNRENWLLSEERMRKIILGVCVLNSQEGNYKMNIHRTIKIGLSSQSELNRIRFTKSWILLFPWVCHMYNLSKAFYNYLYVSISGFCNKLNLKLQWRQINVHVESLYSRNVYSFSLGSLPREYSFSFLFD